MKRSYEAEPNDNDFIVEDIECMNDSSDDDDATDRYEHWGEDEDEYGDSDTFEGQNKKQRNDYSKILFTRKEWKHTISKDVQSELDAENPLYFQVIGVDTAMDYKKDTPIVRLYGVDHQQNTYSINVHGFMPFFYMPAEYWNSQEDFEKQLMSHVDTIKKKRIQQIPSDHYWRRTKEERDKWVISIEVQMKKSIMGYQPEPSKFYKVTVTKPTHVSALRKLFEDDENRKTPQWKPKQTYETTIPFAIRFMTSLSIKGVSWIKLNKYTVPNDRETFRTIELDVQYTDLEVEPSVGKYAFDAPAHFMSIDCEMCGQDGHFPKPEDSPVVTISCTSIWRGKLCEQSPTAQDGARQVIFQLGGTTEIPDATVFNFEREDEMLLAYRDFFLENDPDILTGYNLCFDWPYLLRRAKALGIEEEFSILSVYKHKRTRIQEKTSFSKQRGMTKESHLQMDGRIYLDVIKIVKVELKPSSLALNSVSADVLKEQKDDVHHSAIPKLAKGTNSQRAKLAKYCLKDTVLPLKIAAKKQLFSNAYALAHVAGVPLEYVYSRGQGIRLLSLILSYIRDKGFIIPTQLIKEFMNYIGARVFEPAFGYYGPDEPIATLDFASLYPSIMIALNLCYTTRLTLEQIKKYKLVEGVHYSKHLIKCEIKKSDDEIKAQKDREHKQKMDLKKKMAPIERKKDRSGMKDRSITSFLKNKKKMIEEEEEESTSTATTENVDSPPPPPPQSQVNDSEESQKMGDFYTYFATPLLATGICTEILNYLLDARGKAKMMMENHDVGGTDPNKVLYSKYNALQLGYKVIANSLYGYTASYENALYMPEIGATVTTNGRELIWQSWQYVEKTYPGSRIIYGDTDSIMVRFCVNGQMVNNVPDCMKIAKEAAAGITKHISKPPLKIVFEKVGAPAIFDQVKKRYAFLKWTNPNEYEKIHVAGWEINRRDWSTLTRETMKKCLDYIFIENNPEKAKKYVREQVRMLYLNQMDIGKLVITKSLSREIKNYAGKQTHVELLKRMMIRDPSFEPTIGDRIPFIIVEPEHIKDLVYNAKKKKMEHKEKGTCCYSEDPIYAIKNGIPIDVRYYIDIQLKGPLAKIFLPLCGYSESKYNELFVGEHTLRRIRPLAMKTNVSNSMWGGVIRRCLHCNMSIPNYRDQYGVVYRTNLCETCSPNHTQLYREKYVRELEETRAEHGKLWQKCFVCSEIESIEEDTCKAVSCEQFCWRSQVDVRLHELEEIVKSF